VVAVRSRRPPQMGQPNKRSEIPVDRIAPMIFGGRFTPAPTYSSKSKVAASAGMSHARQARTNAYRQRGHRSARRQLRHQARGVPHAFWNPGSTPALALEITSAGGFETYYNDMAAVASPAEAIAVQAKYGITFNGDLTRQLINRHRRRHPAALALAASQTTLDALSGSWPQISDDDRARLARPGWSR
jgi:hypothetical protein